MFKEFSDPLETDYDISSSLKNDEEIIGNHNKSSKLLMELVDLVGFLEDGEWEKYGISEDEYMNPTEETIEKIKAIVNSNSNKRHL